MPNDSTKHRTFSSHAKQHHAGKSPAVKARPTPADFLIDTNIWPLMLIGKGVKCFGWGAVAAFILGGLSVYGYAVMVKPLPLAKTPIQMVRLHGVVRDDERRPVTQKFWVGVLANQQGPVQNSEGSFVLEVPQSSSYDVALWTNPEQPVSFYNRMPVEQDDKGLKFQNPLPFASPVRTDELSASQPSTTKATNEIARTFEGSR